MQYKKLLSCIRNIGLVKAALVTDVCWGLPDHYHEEWASASPTWEIFEEREEYDKQEIYIFHWITIMIEY